MQPKSLLCVDDDTETLNVRKLLLGASGYSVATAASGAEALDILSRGQQVDLVLLDYMMSPMNGEQLAHKLRETYPTLPLVVLSAVGQLPASLVKIVDATLQKGQDPSVLLSTLEAVLGQAASQSRPVSPPRKIVLCVEDEDLQLQMRRLLFESAGFGVLCARSAKAALEVFATHPIDAVVLDYWLSGADGNGTALAEEMKRLQPHIPILMLSGFAPLPGEGIVVDTWLRKADTPPQLLLYEIQRLIELRSSAAAAQTGS